MYTYTSTRYSITMQMISHILVLNTWRWSLVNGGAGIIFARVIRVSVGVSVMISVGKTLKIMDGCQEMVINHGG